MVNNFNLGHNNTSHSSGIYYFCSTIKLIILIVGKTTVLINKTNTTGLDRIFLNVTAVLKSILKPTHQHTGLQTNNTEHAIMNLSSKCKMLARECALVMRKTHFIKIAL